MFCGHFAIGQIYASGLFHAITGVNVVVPLPSLAEECDDTEHKDHAAKNDQRLEVHGGLTDHELSGGPIEGRTTWES
jgi:hypothetical protein